MLFVCHDRELLARTATRIITLELGAAGNTVWIHGGGFASYAEARAATATPAGGAPPAVGRGAREAQGAGARCRQKAEYNDGMAVAYQAALTRLRAFERGGPPQAVPREQEVKMRLRGGRTGKRAVVCEWLELTGLMKPFDLEVWFGERVAVLGSNGSGKSHFLRLLAAGGSRSRPRAPAGRRGARSRRSRTPATRGSARGCGPAGSRRPTSIRS